MTRKEAAEIIERDFIEYFEGDAPVWKALKMAADALKNDDAVINKILEIIDSYITIAEEIGYNNYTLYNIFILRVLKKEIKALKDDK